MTAGPKMRDRSLLVCPICGICVALKDGAIARHDNTPCLCVCRASTLTLDEAMRLRAQDDEIQRDYYSGPSGSFTGD